MRFAHIFSVALTALLLCALSANGQEGGGRGGRGGGFRSRDPNESFNRLANGKEIWIRSEITDQRRQGFFDMIAGQLGVTNGQITREQFVSFSANMRQRFRQGGGEGQRFAGPPQPGAPNSEPPARDAGVTVPADQAADASARAERVFQRLDLNGDGYLNYDEMPEDLRAERDKWDTDKNHLIDLTEFKAYFQARMRERAAERGAADADPAQGAAAIVVPMADPPEEDKKPEVYHAGNLPKELPSWFAQLDTDGDGQIGLYEWKASGRPIEEFFKIDRNKDGFLTVAEVLAYEAEKKKGNGALARSRSERREARSE